MESFKGKKALITGGTKGLGLEIARELARNGVDCFLGYRSDAEGAKKAVAEIEGFGVKAWAIEVDLSESEGVTNLFSEVQKQTNELDIYIHNAAATAFKPLLEIKAHHVLKTMNLTVASFILGVQDFVKMTPPGGGAVVAVSGMDTLTVVPRHGLLGAAKAALEQLTTYYAHELAEKKIQVNAVNPGFLETESTQKYLGPAFDLVSKGHAAATPAKRPAELAEVARVVRFLCSEDSSWVVGQTITVDGGFNKSLTIVPN